MARTRSTGAPVAAPPTVTQGDGAGSSVETKPVDLTDAQLGGVGAAAGADSITPSLAPPGEGAGLTEALSAGAGTGTWQADKRVTALWSINQVRNDYAYIAGIGWKKLYNASDSSITAMTMLASHAKEKNTRFDYREEADGMIHEIYAW